MLKRVVFDATDQSVMRPEVAQRPAKVCQAVILATEKQALPAGCRRDRGSMISKTVVEKPSVAWPAAKVEISPIGRLTTNPRNARIHGPEQIEQIRASLREFGWTMPVLVRENGILIAGHGRLEAAKLEGIEEVPTIVARGWSEAAGKMSRDAADLHSTCDPSRFAVSPW